MNNVNLNLILLKPRKSDIFCDDYCQEAMEHNLLSDYPINKFKVAYCLVSIYTHVGWYRIVFKGGDVPSIEMFFFVISNILHTI